jgi:putative serine protease PepD
MTPTTLDPPPLWSDDRPPDQPPPPPPPTAPPEGRRRRRPPLAVLLVTTALLGGGTGAGVVAATGAAGGSRTTVIERTTSGTTDTSAFTSSGGLDAEALYASTSAGVVDITVKTTATQSSAPSPFGGGGGQQQEATATGTGFVVDSKGNIVTAAHVVDGATSVTVKLQDGTTRKATVLGKDDATDIAVIKIDPSGLTLHPLTLGSSSSVDVGAEVAAIGDPFGYARSLSTGIVSGVDRTIEAPNGFTVAHAIQTDAAMNPGNSGGPVLDADGKVIGIADQIATDGSADQSSGVGFAVPIDLVKSALVTLEAGGKVEHAYLGVSTGDATDGAAVSAVTGGGPAAGAGLKAGDVITTFAGKSVADSTGLVSAIASHKPGEEVKVTVERGSGTQELTVTLGTQPTQRASTGG